MQGGCVAGDTSRQIATRFAAATAPIAFAHDIGALGRDGCGGRATLAAVVDGAVDGADEAVDAATRFATAACGVRSGVGPHAAIINVAAVSQVLLDPVFIGPL